MDEYECLYFWAERPAPDDRSWVAPILPDYTDLWLLKLAEN